MSESDSTVQDQMPVGGRHRRLLKSVADFAPAIGFFGVFFVFGRDMITATAGLAVGLVAQLAIYALIREKIATWMKILTVIALIFAGMTLIFDDPNFIKIRSSVSGFLVGCFFAGSVLIKKNILQIMLGKFINFPQRTWNIVTLLWSVPIFVNAGFNLFMANLLPWPNWALSDDVWMSYRVVSGFVVTGLSFGFVLAYLFATKQKPRFSDPSDSADAS